MINYSSENGYSVAVEIAVLKRHAELIVFNAEQVNPIFFQHGGDEAIAILQELKKSGVLFRSSLPSYCSQELFDFFLLHWLIVPVVRSATTDRACICDCQSSGNISHSRSIYLLLTQSCNQACVYCFNGKDTYRKNDHLKMSEDVAFRSLEQIINSILPDGRMEVVFFGGEPLMNWHLAKRVVEYCENALKPRHPKKKILYHVTTNLTLFPNDLIEFARSFNLSFLVDIDGPENIHNRNRPFVNGKGSFRRSAANIAKLVNAGIKVQLRATVTSQNDSHMLEIAKTHQSLGGSGCAFVPLNPVDSDNNLLSIDICPSPRKYAMGLREVYHSGIWPIENLFPFNEYVSRLRPGYRNQWGCGAPFGNTPVIAHNGSIYSCIYLVGHKRYETGNVLMNDFPRRNVVTDMLAVVDVNKKIPCRKCGIRFLCGGGCPVGEFSIAVNKKASKELKAYVRRIACTTSKIVIHELLWRMAEFCPDVSDTCSAVKFNP